MLRVSIDHCFKFIFRKITVFIESGKIFLQKSTFLWITGRTKGCPLLSSLNLM